MSTQVSQSESKQLHIGERAAARAVERSRNKTTCRSCPACQHYNADADGPMMEVSSGGRVYEVCPNCWYRFELVTTEAP